MELLLKKDHSKSLKELVACHFLEANCSCVKLLRPITSFFLLFKNYSLFKCVLIIHLFHSFQVTEKTSCSAPAPLSNSFSDWLRACFQLRQLFWAPWKQGNVELPVPANERGGHGGCSQMSFLQLTAPSPSPSPRPRPPHLSTRGSLSRRWGVRGFTMPAGSGDCPLPD